MLFRIGFGSLSGGGRASDVFVDVCWCVLLIRSLCDVYVDVCWCVLLIKFLLCIGRVVSNNVSNVGASCIVLSVDIGVCLGLFVPLVCVMH